MKSKLAYDKNGSLYLAFEQAPGIAKRAWIQHREKDGDWAGCGRYVNFVRTNGGIDDNPGGSPTDRPVYASTAISDREILIHCVLEFGADLSNLVDHTASTAKAA